MLILPFNFNSNPTPINNDLTAASLEEINHLFNEYREMDLNWHIPEYGCQARSHIFSYMAEKYHDLKIAKVMITSEDDRNNFVISSSPSKQNICYKWLFHVAPTVYFKGNKSEKADFYVLDPDLFDKPVPIKKWFASFSSSNPQVKLKTNIVTRFKAIPSSIDNSWDWSDADIDGSLNFLKKQKHDFEKFGHLQDGIISCPSAKEESLRHALAINSSHQ